MALSSSLASAQLGPCDCPPVADRPIVEVGDADGMGTGTVTWSCDSLYVLTETVFVNPGDALTILPGTVIQGRTGIVSDTLTIRCPTAILRRARITSLAKRREALLSVQVRRLSLTERPIAPSFSRMRAIPWMEVQVTMCVECGAG